MRDLAADGAGQAPCERQSQARPVVPVAGVRASAANEVPRRASSAGWSSAPKRWPEPTALHWVAWSVMVRTGRSARPTASRTSA
ncbi:hypothetical protein ACOT8G_32640 [Streptomyces sp. NY05-11A]